MLAMRILHKKQENRFACRWQPQRRKGREDFIYVFLCDLGVLRGSKKNLFGSGSSGLGDIGEFVW